MSLDRNSPIPLHLQLKTWLTTRIAEGEFEPGGRLPSERQLCEELGISRTTVREALRELEREGLIRIVPGRAAYAATPQSGLTVKVSLSGFVADIRREGMTPSGILLETRLLPTPPSDLVRAMRLQPGDEVVVLERLRFANKVPLVVHVVHLNHRLCPQVLAENLEHASLYGLYRERYGLTPARAEQQVYAGLASPRELELLNLTAPAAVLRVERSIFLDDGQVVEFSRSAYCGEWYRLSMLLEPPE